MGNYKEVIRFACGLTAETQAVLEFVYDLWCQKSLGEDDLHRAHDFLKSLWNEVYVKGEIDPSHNKYINVIESKEDGEKICVPSRYYHFRPETSDALKFHVDESCDSSESVPTAECIIHARNDDQLLETLRAIKEISKFQKILVNGLHIVGIDSCHKDEYLKQLFNAVHTENFNQECSDIIRMGNNGAPTVKILKQMFEAESNHVGDDETLRFMTELLQHKCKMAFEDGDDEINKLATNTIRISTNIRYLFLTNFVLSQTVFSHIVKQIHGCNQLQHLTLSGIIGVTRRVR